MIGTGCSPADEAGSERLRVQAARQRPGWRGLPDWAARKPNHVFRTTASELMRITGANAVLVNAAWAFLSAHFLSDRRRSLSWSARPESVSCSGGAFAPVNEISHSSDRNRTHRSQRRNSSRNG
jgi:hypothetical protein